MEKGRLREILEEEIEKLISMSEGYASSEVAMHEIEKGLLSQVLQLCLALLKWIVEQKLKQLSNYRPQFILGTYYKAKGARTRKYLSLFGFVEITRPSYWSEACGMFYKLDEYLKLPIGRNWSYNLQELIGENASENDFRESVRVVNKLLGLALSSKSSERNADYLGPVVEDYYSQRQVKVEHAPVCFSASFDGKGVPKIGQAAKPKTNPKERLKRGEKKGVKQMATVSVTSCFTPKKQTVQGIIEGLMGSELSQVEAEEQAQKSKTKRKNENDNRWHKGIHRRSFLADQEKAVDYGISDIKQRMKNPKSRFVVPIDAGIGLEEKVMASIKRHRLEAQFDGIILDIIHVSEYVWDAGTALFGENSKLRSPWVREMLTDLLNSKTIKVIEDLKLIVQKTELSASKKETINKTITYFTNHQHKMNYKEFINKGYPVSSALVESSCGHLVKERMEQSGMRWSSSGAQNIMDLRAVKLNGDMADFLNFVIDVDRKVDLIKIAA